MKKEFDELKKGFYSLFSSYGIGEKKNSNAINSFDKKGSDIKSGISTLIGKLQARKKELLGSMEELLEGFSRFAPTKESDNYEEFKHLFDFIPKIFEYDVIYNGRQFADESTGIVKQEMVIPTEEERNVMRKYNCIVGDYLESCMTIIKLDTVKRNIQDNVNYTLTVDQLTILGL
jgi:hypothetical protein